MKNLLKSIYVGLFWLTSGVFDAQATHLMGSDIIYRCLGNGKYEITVRVYRDCNGIQVSQSPIVVSCSGTTLTINNQTKVSTRDITGIDPNCPVQSKCAGQWTYGIEEHVWTAEVDLSSYNCCEWKISWQQSARNSNIGTGQADQNFYTFATLNKCVTPCNNSPDFTNPPVAILCRNQDFVFNNGALDTLDSGDSLSYHLAPALQANGVSCTYNPPYSYNNPMPIVNMNPNLPYPFGFRLDPETGDIMFRPNQVIVGVAVVEVKEWRMVNGVMTVVGVTRRDMQLIVIPCPNNNVPKITGTYTAQACAGQKTCLTINTTDIDNADTVKISWNKGLKGATFSNNNGSVKHASGQVCWTPTEADVSTIPYTFTVTARDNSCNPFPGQSVRAYSVFVRSTPEAEVGVDLLTCGKVAFHHQAKKQYPNYIFSYEVWDEHNRPLWSSKQQEDTAFLQPGKYSINLKIQAHSPPCYNVVSDTFTVPDFVTVGLPEDTLVCNGIPVNVMSTTKGGNAPYEYEWAMMTDSGASEVLSTDPDKTINHDSATTYLIRIKDANGCHNFDTILVGWRERPVFNTGIDQRICYGSSATIQAPFDSTHFYLWSTGDTVPGIDVRDSNAYWVKVTDSAGCWYTDTQNVFVNRVHPEPGHDRFICENESISLVANGADSYQWFLKEGFTEYPLPAPLGTGNTLNYTITKSTGFIVRGTQTYEGVTCSGFDSVEVTMNPLPVVDLENPPAMCLNGAPLPLISLIKFPTLYNGSWRSDAQPASVSSGVFFPAKAGVNAFPGHPVIYQVTDHNGCVNEKAVPIRVHPLPEIELIDSLLVCGDVILLDLNSGKTKPTATQTFSGIPNWYSLNNHSQVNNALVKTNVHDQKLMASLLPPGIYPLVFEFTNNSTKCRNADTIPVRVKAVPNTSAGNLTPPCWNEGAIDLNVSANPSPAGGVWSSPDIAVNGHQFLPSSLGAQAKFALPGTNVRFIYTVTWEGCPKADTLHTLIKGIPDLALTPFDGWCENAGTKDLAPLSNLTGGSWSGPGVSGTTFNPLVAGVGTSHWLGYRVSNPATNCFNADSFPVEVQPAPKLEMTTSDKACEGQPYDVEVTLENAAGVLVERIGDGEFDFQGSGRPSSTLLKTSYFPGNADNTTLSFTLHAATTNNRYCAPAEASKQISIFPLPEIAIQADPLVGCDPLPINFEAITNAASGAELEWDFGNGTWKKGLDELRTVEDTFNGPGTYSVSLKMTANAANGSCVNEADPVQIQVLPTPEADFTVNRWKTTVALPGIQFMDKSTVAAPAVLTSWHWSFGDKNNSQSTVQNPYFEYPVSEPTDTGTYLVKLLVKADNGCEAGDFGHIHIAPDLTIFIPNAFTPNNFGEEMNNRYFVIADGFETFEITVFTRWGEKVYHSANINEGWDGKYKGVEAQQDVYMYVVRVTSTSGKEYEYYGTITLLR